MPSAERGASTPSVLRSLLMPAVAMVALWCTATGCGTPVNMVDADALANVRRVAVLEFSGVATVDGAKPGDALAGAVVQAIRTELPHIEVVERARIAQLLEEAKFDSIGITDGVAKLGRVLGVDAVVLGDTLQYTHDNRKQSGVFSGGFASIYNVGASMRIVDVAKGRIIYARSAGVIRNDSFGPAVEQVAEALLLPLKLRGAGSRR